MKKNLWLGLIVFITITFLPSLTLAQGTVINTELGNNISNFGQFLSRIFAWGIPITAGIAVIMFIWAGYLYMTSQGDTGKIGEAKEIIIGVVVGVMLLFTVGIIMRNVLGTIRTGTGPTSPVATATQIRGISTSNIQQAISNLQTSANPTSRTAATQAQSILDKLKSGALSQTDAAKQIQAIAEQLKRTGDSNAQTLANSIATAAKVMAATDSLQKLESIMPTDIKTTTNDPAILSQAQKIGADLQKLGLEIGVFGGSDFTKDLQRIGIQIQAGTDLAKYILELKNILTTANVSTCESVSKVDPTACYEYLPQDSQNTTEATATDTSGGYEYTKPSYKEPGTTYSPGLGDLTSTAAPSYYDYTKPDFHEPSSTYTTTPNSSSSSSSSSTYDSYDYSKPNYQQP